MLNNLKLQEQIKEISDPKVLQKTLLYVLFKMNSLEQRLSTIDEKYTGNEEIMEVISNKRDRLDQIRYALTEMNERMERPYIVSAELQSVKDVLDVLAEDGICNSVILEGEAGTGKTQWAYHEVGQALQEGQNVSLVHVRVKDTMRAQDLLYSIDDVRRLSDAQAQAQVPEKIRQQADFFKQKILNLIIDPNEDQDYLHFKSRMNAIVELGETAKDLDYINYVNLGPLGEAIYQSGKGKKVYLIIDEIEKGREELMTGILDEIENLTFNISETGTIVKGDKKNLRIIITTNTEDSDKIPPSFRRRSLYHFMDYPKKSDMVKIVELNFPDIHPDLLDYAISVFYQYHENDDINKKPSTPELLAWIRVLLKGFDGSIPEDIPYKEILLKYNEDQEFDIGKINVKNDENIENSESKIPNFIFRALQGEPVFFLNPQLDSYQKQELFYDFYATLQEAGLSFVTPKFNEISVRDRYGDYETVQKNVRNFQFVIPGVENVGDGGYVIPEDRMELLKPVIDSQAYVLPAGQKFSSIYSKSKNLTKGVIDVNGDSCEAYMVENGQIVVVQPFTN